MLQTDLTSLNSTCIDNIFIIIGLLVLRIFGVLEVKPLECMKYLVNLRYIVWFLGCPMWRQELDSVILLDPFQPGMISYSMILLKPSSLNHNAHVLMCVETCRQTRAQLYRKSVSTFNQQTGLACYWAVHWMCLPHPMLLSALACEQTEMGKCYCLFLGNLWSSGVAVCNHPAL